MRALVALLDGMCDGGNEVLALALTLGIGLVAAEEASIEAARHFAAEQDFYPDVGCHHDARLERWLAEFAAPRSPADDDA